MDIVVKLPNKDYQVMLTKVMIACGCEVIELPKGHGDLIDINEVKKKYPLEIAGLDLRSNNQCLHTVMDEAQIIINADKTESEEQAKLIDDTFDAAIKVLKTLLNEDWEKYSDKLYKRAYDKGYGEGYDKGFDGGYDRGHSEGYEECHDDMQSMMGTE